MQTSPENCQPDSIEYAAHYTSAAPSFVPFQGRSHTVDGSAPTRHPTASFIPAVHQQRLVPSTQQAAPIHSLNSTSALRPLQREEFLAKLPKVKFCCCVLCNIHVAHEQHHVLIKVILDLMVSKGQMTATSSMLCTMHALPCHSSPDEDLNGHSACRAVQLLILLISQCIPNLLRHLKSC